MGCASTSRRQPRWSAQGWRPPTVARSGRPPWCGPPRGTRGRSGRNGPWPRRSSFMIATQPLGDDFWADAGLDGRATFADNRHLTIYGSGRPMAGWPSAGGGALPLRVGHTSRVRPRRWPAPGPPIHPGRAFRRPGRGRHHPSLGVPAGSPATGCRRSASTPPTAWVGRGATWGRVSTTNMAGRTLRDLILVARQRADQTGLGRASVAAVGTRTPALPRYQRRAPSGRAGRSSELRTGRALLVRRRPPSCPGLGPSATGPGGGPPLLAQPAPWTRRLSRHRGKVRPGRRSRRPARAASTRPWLGRQPSRPPVRRE